MIIADTHAHLADPAFATNISEIVDTAIRSGVKRILSVGTDVLSSSESIRLAERFPDVYAGVGIHPHEASQFSQSALSEIQKLAAHPKVVAIGEIGLDYFRSGATASDQQRAFTEQLALAATLDLPVVVHDRDAHADVLRLISNVPRSSDLAHRAGVLHCFSGDEALAKSAIKHGFFISFAGNITYRRADDLRSVVSTIPIERLLTETDSPFLSPQPVRGQVNHPANVQFVVETLASIRGKSIESMAAETWANAVQLFRWNPSGAPDEAGRAASRFRVPDDCQ